MYSLFPFKNAVRVNGERGQEVKFDGDTALTHSVEKKKEKKVHILFLKKSIRNNIICRTIQ